MDMQINKHFLRQEREKRAWSQSHLADVADLSMRTVHVLSTVVLRLWNLQRRWQPPWTWSLLR